ncbi:metallophosphoesterase [Marinobacterium rhizophilum]|uniref:Metallophosphoesterase n=1 Tax=Marinobacterium rhizophilum TaxID=420402 RepID=A0ABY5HNB1_9GAMM|nr:metallophosphoesterase [Marinobacterium rhizophilum]UTW13778.1 metallophosphoesterase [Marinobacterium rhizophilum]
MPDIKGFDLIGDVHGCALSLSMLLERLGYRRERGTYCHPSRQALFVGDIIDRGPRIRESLHLVRDMVEAGAAQVVMGNHEYNFLCYCTPGRPGSGLDFLRSHTPRHHRVLKETLDAFASHPQEQADFLTWIRDMPIFLEFEHFRVIHACWPQALIDRFARDFGGNRISEDFLHRSVDPETFECELMDRALRGTQMKLPNGAVITSKDGFQRRYFRTKFWSGSAERYADVVFQPDPLPGDIARMPLSEQDRAQLLHYGEDEKLLFVGHYWRDGEPAPITSNIACLDYSAVKFGKLVAYRYDHEPRIDPAKFVWVDIAREVRAPEPGDVL